MTTCNTEEQCLDDITVGDTLKFDFEFSNPDMTEKDISGKELIFILTRNEEKGKEDLHYTETFPENKKSTHGKGHMDVPPSKTEHLLPDTEYKFKFKFVEGPKDVETLGSGLVQVVS